MSYRGNKTLISWKVPSRHPTPPHPPRTPRTHTSHNHTHCAVQMHKHTQKAFISTYQTKDRLQSIWVQNGHIDFFTRNFRKLRKYPHRHIHTSHIRCYECGIVHTYRNKRPRMKHLSSNEWHSLDQMGPCDYPNQDWLHAY